MDRRSFLIRSLAAVGALSLGRLPVSAPAAAVPEELVDGGALELGVIRDSALVATNDYQIFGESLVASGGLCAPVEPYYTLLPRLSSARPIRDSLPAFNADRGGVRYARPD